MFLVSMFLKTYVFNIQKHVGAYSFGLSTWDILHFTRFLL